MISSSGISKGNFVRVIYLGLSIMTLFVAYNTHNNIQAQLYDQLGLGIFNKINHFTVFGCFALISIISAYFSKKISTKLGFVLGGVGPTAAVIGGLLTSYCYKSNLETGLCNHSVIVSINIFFACIAGICAAFFWLYQGVYVNTCTDDRNKGYLNGTFWSIFQMAQIMSSLFATFVFTTVDQLTFYCVLIILAGVSLVMLSFVKPPLGTPENSVIEIKKSIRQLIKEFCHVSTEYELRFLHFGILFSGIAIGCSVGFISDSVPLTLFTEDKEIVNKHIGYALIVLAVGGFTAGYSAGRLADVFVKRRVFTLVMVINELALLTTLLAYYFASYPMVLVAAFLWGHGNTSIQTMINALIGSSFGGRPEVFCVYRFLQSIGIIITALMSTLIPKKSWLAFGLIIAGLMGVSHVLYLLNLRKRGGASLFSQEKLLGIETESASVDLNRYSGS